MSRMVAPGKEQPPGPRPPLARFAGIRPAEVVSCAGAAEVAQAIAEARAAGLPLAVRSGGHCFAGRSSTDGMLIDVSPMSAVEYAVGRARIGAGALLGDVYDALDAHGVTIPAGCGTTVGIAGLTLGGGLGILGRLHGLLADSLLGAEVVLADGRAVDADPELLWALKGAGGMRFGVVTALEFATVPAPRMTAFETFWADPAALIAAWQEWGPAAPDALAASLLITAEDDVEVKVFGAFAGPEDELRSLVAALGEPESARFAEGSARAAKRFLAGLGGADEDDEGHAYVRSEYFADRLSEDAIAALVAALAGGGFVRELDFSPWGGAYTRTPAAASAFAHRDARFLLKHGAVVAPGGPAEAAREWLDRSWAIAHPHGTGGAYPNFPEDGLDPWAPEYLGANRERLLEIKRRYDPEGVFG
jgi:FAD/FMN-containing dehydrogenase